MDYTTTLDYLYSRLPMYQRVGAAALKPNLENTRAIDQLFGKPSKKFKSIHVAGTNGKGSVSHSLASVLQSAGYKVGLYTSPHLKDFRERIRINGAMVPESFVVDFVQKYREFESGLTPSFFELTVIMAFDFFAKEEVDIAVVEVGLGGRLDSTNIIIPELSIITNISLDHTNLLGNSLAEIAIEKAGIIKDQVPVIIGETLEETEGIFQTKAKQHQCTILFADQEFLITKSSSGMFQGNNQCQVYLQNIELDLKGNYQKKNLTTILASVDRLQKAGWNITDNAVLGGLKSVTGQTGLLGRWQKLNENPTVICDTGHNEAGVREIVQQLSQLKYNQLHIVLGMANDKLVDSVLKLLPVEAVYYFTQAAINRALPAEELQQAAMRFGLNGNVFSSVQKAYNAALENAANNDFVFVGGSTFVVAEVI